MNKLVTKPKAEPLLHPSPDLKNRSKIQGTASPVRQVKLFLENAKHAHRQKQAITTLPLEQKSRYSSTQQILRKRIDELQIQNNQFRSLAKEYELLVERNRSLEAQMLLLLNQLEQGNQEEYDQSHSLTHQRKGYLKEQNNTTQSSHEHSPSNKGNQDSAHFGRTSRSNQIKIVHPFDSSDDHDILEENRRLRQENERVQERIDSSIRQAIAQLQQKFMAYITALQEKLAALAATNRQAALMAAREDSSKSSRQNLRERERKDSESHPQSQKSGFSLNPRKTFQLQLQSRQRQVQQSKVDIKFSQLSESNMQYGNHFKSPPHNTPNSFFRNVEFIDSEMPTRPLFQESALEQALHQVSILRKHLSVSFTAADVQPYFKNLRSALQAELRDLLSVYFPGPSLEIENSQLRRKVAELSAQLGRGQFLRVQASGSKGASELYLQQSYYLSIQPQQLQEYEQSKRKLGEVIEVVRNFNRDYRYLLSESSRSSLVLLSAHKEK